MAESTRTLTTKDNAGAAAGAAGAGAGAGEPRFEIRTPNPGFAGERFGVKIRDGVGTTDDEAAARQLADVGYAVKDRKGKLDTELYKITGGDRRRIAALGVRYSGDVGFTDDARRAKSAIEFGGEVTDVSTGQPPRWAVDDEPAAPAKK